MTAINGAFLKAQVYLESLERLGLGQNFITIKEKLHRVEQQLLIRLHHSWPLVEAKLGRTLPKNFITHASVANLDDRILGESNFHVSTSFALASGSPPHCCILFAATEASLFQFVL